MVESLDGSDARRLLRAADRAALDARGTPVLIAVLDTPLVIWANTAAEATFGTSDPKRLTGLIFGGASHSAMIERLRRLRPGAPDQLERLAFVSGFQVERLTLLSRAVADPRIGSAVVLQIVGNRASDSAPPKEVPARNDDPSPASSTVPALSEARAAAPGAAAQDASWRSLDQIASLFSERVSSGRQPRFVWESDRDGVLVSIGAGLASLVGATAPAPGDSLTAAVEAKAPDFASAIREAFASGRSWSGLTVPWPVERSDAVVPVTLGAAPLPGDRAGFRGFGVVHVERMARPVPPAMAHPASVAILAENDGIGRSEPAEPALAPSAVSEGSDAAERAGSAEVAIATPGLDWIREIGSAGASATTPEESGQAKIEEPSPVAPDRSKIVHLLQFKNDHAASGQLGSPKIMPRLPRPEAVTETPQLPPEPQWSETPATAGPQPQLTIAEQSAFDEIARTLAGQEPVAQEGNEGEGGSSEPTSPPQAASSASPLPASVPEQAPLPDAAALLDKAPIGILVVQRDRPVYANRTLLDLIGFDDRASFIEQTDLAGLFGSGSDSVPTAEGPARALTLAVRSGGEVPVDGRVQSIDWQGAPATLMSFRRSIEEEASARIEAVRLDLRRSQGVAQDLAETLDLAGIRAGVLDASGRLLTINPAAERFFGYDQREVVGDAGALFVAPHDRAAFTAFVAPFIGGHAGDAASRRFFGRTRDDALAPLEIGLKALDDGRTLIVWKDAPRDTDNRTLDSAREEAERASAMKSEFLAKVSHEIRTPLNAIIGFTEVMMEERFGAIGNERYKEYLRDIHTAGTHVVSLVNDLLDLSRIEAGRLDLKLVAVNVNDIVGQCVATLQTQAHRERVILRLSLAPRLGLVLADERALRQIVLNLLSNAVKFNEPGGQVIVSTTATEKGAITLRIRDTGLGMSERDIETAMQPFRQLETPKASVGSGLGLPLTKALVEANHAIMVIKSRPQEGTLVEVTLQAAPAEATSLPAE